jgi:hypothetical protein
LPRVRPVAPIPLAARSREPRLQFREPTAGDPQQFAALRALPADRNRFRGSPVEAKLEWRLSGDPGDYDSQVEVGGLPRRITRALAR